MTSPIGLSFVLLGIGLGACATAGAPMNAEEPAAAIRAAEEVGADRVPQAALRLQLAKEKFERARTMTSEEQRPAAARVLMCSKADAELAVALTRASQASAEAEKAKEKTTNLHSPVN